MDPTGIPKSSVQRYAKKNKIKHYKTHLVHGLLEDDPDRRLEFCSKIIEKTDVDSKWHEGIVFLDEATFYRTGTVNRHNCHYYNTKNPHILQEEKLKSTGITVWAAVTKDGVLSYDISRQTMTGERYASVLSNHIVPHLSQPEMKDVFFQQDGAPPHYANVAKAVLDQNLPNRWIGRGSSFMDWPPRSPDLTVCDFFLWGFLKEKVYCHNIATDDELMRLIEEELLLIPRELFSKAYDCFLFRCHQCIAIDGNQFE
ncbi:hypothetical protein CE195_08405 [Sodalis-like symbiont of Philaenus spumarius]|nr:hypothetical protein CE195_08405 [Sodalis-like symbiont of Philaenus spumarius]